MADLEAPGLPGNWLNGWLAALGVTVLVPGARLHWTDDPVPIAIFGSDDGVDLPEEIAATLPSAEAMASMFHGARLRRGQTSLHEYRDCAGLARSNGDLSLGSSLTELARHRGKKEPAPHPSRFYASGPGTVGTLWDRLRSCRQKIDAPPPEAIGRTFAGHGPRVIADGLGFDYRRFALGDTKNRYDANWVDPCVECMAFFALGFFPVRGNGVCASTRGWRRDGRKTSFVWPIWSPPMDRWAIDAALGLAFSQDKIASWPRLHVGITQAFETVEYKPGGSYSIGLAARRVF